MKVKSGCKHKGSIHTVLRVASGVPPEHSGDLSKAHVHPAATDCDSSADGGG